MEDRVETVEIIKKINPLSLTQKMLIVEKIIHSIREKEQKTILAEAADALYNRVVQKLKFLNNFR
jgi:hypothetical protein